LFHVPWSGDGAGERQGKIRRNGFSMCRARCRWWEHRSPGLVKMTGLPTSLSPTPSGLSVNPQASQMDAAILALSILPFLNNVPAVVTVGRTGEWHSSEAIETVLDRSRKCRSRKCRDNALALVVAGTPTRGGCSPQANETAVVEVNVGSKHPQLVEVAGQTQLGTLFSAEFMKRPLLPSGRTTTWLRAFAACFKRNDGV